jgi:small ligand-binding sensory domain FIST
MVALACRLEDGAFELIGPITKPAAADGIGSGGNVAGFGVVHADPRNNQASEIVAAIARRTGAYLVGGFTSAGAAFPQAAGTRAVEGCVSGVLLGGRLSVAVGLTQGCTPVGPAHEVTRADGQVLITLDRQRAFDILCEDVGVAEGADPRPWLANVHAALPVPGSDTADYVVRNLIGIDPRHGLVAIADTPAAGDRVLFVRRDAESARKDLARMLSDLKARLTGTPRAGLYYSCVARGPNLFEGEAFELKAIAEAFGDIPIAGFFGNGEISNNRVYGYTGVLTLFC